MREDLLRVERSIVDALAQGGPIDPYALRFLLWQFQATEREDLADAAGRALAQAIDDGVDPPSALAGAAWLGVFVDAASCSDDVRLFDSCDRLVQTLRGHWHAPVVEDAAAAIGACLDAVRLDRFRPLAADAIDALEHLVKRAYRPGAGVGAFADQVRTAFALLTAYLLSARLPYSMLAEELMQSSRYGEPDDREFAAACEAVRVLCRLAALHDDAAYRAAAVVAPGADYRRDAQQLLSRQAREAQRRGAAGAIYGVALLELESASFNPASQVQTPP